MLFLALLLVVPQAPNQVQLIWYQVKSEVLCLVLNRAYRPVVLSIALFLVVPQVLNQVQDQVVIWNQVKSEVL